MRKVFLTGKPRHDPGYLPSRGLQVPLIASGEVHQGYFDVPAAAVRFREHSNQVLSYSNHVRQKVRDWIEWKERQGWFMRGRPRLYVPLPKPNAYGEEVEEDVMRVYVDAVFYRRTALRMTLDDFLHRQDQARRYGVDLSKPRRPSNALPAVQSELVADGQRDPLVLAEERRKRLGLERRVVVRDGEAVGADVVAISPPQREDAEGPSAPR